VKPGDLDNAFEVVCTHADVVFPAGDASRPDATQARAALEQFWERLQALLPGPIDPDTKCPVQKAMRKFRRRFRVAALAEPRVVEPPLLLDGEEGQRVHEDAGEGADARPRWHRAPSPDADALHAEFKSRGVKIVRDVFDQPYRCRDFEVEDCNGYRLCFGQTL